MLKTKTIQTSKHGKNTLCKFEMDNFWKSCFRKKREVLLYNYWLFRGVSIPPDSWVSGECSTLALLRPFGHLVVGKWSSRPPMNAHHKGAAQPRYVWSLEGFYPWKTNIFWSPKNWWVFGSIFLPFSFLGVCSVHFQVNQPLPYPHPKTKMTGWKIHGESMYFVWKMGKFSGDKFPC